MKINFILFVFTFFNFFHCGSMEQKSLNPMKDALTRAFTAFNLSADNYSVQEDNCAELTPAKDIRRWDRIGNQIVFTRDICSNPELTEFAAYCIAADVKNSGYLKSQLATWGSYATAIGTPALTAYLSKNNPYCCSLLLASFLPVLTLGTDFCNMHQKLSHAINTRFATIAFKLACQKLVEEKKFKVLTTYYAFARRIKHTPLSSDDQYWIIENSLNAKKYSIESVVRDNSIESHIVDSENKRVASSFYPPNEPK